MVVSVLFVSILCHRMNLIDGESQPLGLTFTFPIYLLWLIKEVVVTNIAVAGCVWKGNHTLNSKIIKVTADQKTDLGKVIYASSITLTPGTVSIDLIGNEITVHALTDEAAADLLTGEMNIRVCKVEG
jgi:multicomponent Na+:H+ antiporter subunit E